MGFTINKYFNMQMKCERYDYDDLFQMGCIGLIKAAKKFNPKYKVEFSTYAVTWIRSQIYRYFSLEYRATGGEKGQISIYANVHDTEKVEIGDMLSTDDFVEKVDNSIYVKELLCILDNRERKVIEDLFFRNRVQTDIAKELGVSQIQVSRIRSKALKKMNKGA